MTTYERICVEDFTITDSAGQSLELKRGTEYLTGREREDGTVMVFSSYWVRVPVTLFAGAILFTGKPEKEKP